MLCAYAAVALSAPTISWTPELGAYYAAVGNHIRVARSSNTIAPPTCDLSKVTMPVAPTPLPSPTGTLQQIVLGRGVQVGSHNFNKLISSLTLTRITHARLPVHPSHL